MEEEVITKITCKPEDLKMVIDSLSEEDRASLIDATVRLAETVNAILAAVIDEEETDHASE